MTVDDGDGAQRPGVYAGPPQGPPAFVPEPEPDGLTLRDYLAVIWRRKWIILLVIVIATASAYYFSNRQQRRYTADGTIFFRQQIDLANPLTGNSTDATSLDRQMATIGDLMAGPVLQSRAALILTKAQVDVQAGFTVTAARQKLDSTAGSSNSASNVVVVSGDSTDPKLAAAAANAFMTAYVAWDTEQQRNQIQRAIPVIESQLAGYTTNASKLTSDYVMLKQRLQDLLILKETTTGSFQVLAPAAVPKAPYAPNPLRSALLGLAVGLFAGIGLAFLLEQFDTRIRRPDQIAQILRQPILGRVPRISKRLLGESAMVTLRHPDGQVAEAFRMVRTNLDFMSIDAEVKSMVVTSCMKGEGKSVTVANLAATMALAGKKVIVVDGDLRRPRMHKYFGIANEAGVSTVVSGRDKLSAAMVPIAVKPATKGDNAQDFETWAAGSDARSYLYVLPSGPIPPNPGEIVASRRFEAMLETLTDEADLVVIDSPAMLAVGDTSVIAAKVDGLVFLVDMQVIKTPQLMTAADQLRRLPVKMLGTVVRMYSGKGSRYYYSPYYYSGYTYAEDGVKARRDRRRGSHEGSPTA